MTPYIAGFFDAEGCVWLGKGNTSIILRAQFAQKDPTILEAVRAHQQLEARVCHGKLNFNGQHAVQILTAMQPFLIVKDYEAALGLQLYSQRSTETVTTLCIEWKNRIRKTAQSKIMTGIDLDMYTAGFLDGDGYISKVDQHVRISQSVISPLELFKDTYGGQIFERKDGIYQWTIWNAQCRTFLERIRPYLLSPRHQYW